MSVAATEVESFRRLHAVRAWIDRDYMTRAELAAWCAQLEAANDGDEPAELEAALDPFWSDLAAAWREAARGREWLLEGAIARTPIVIFSGPEKTVKSWAMLDLAIAVSTASKWLGQFQAHRSGTVVYLDGEYGDIEIARRLVRLARGRGIDPALVLDGRIKHLDSSSLLLDTSTAGWVKLVTQLKALGPVVVIVDPFRNHLDGDENAAKDVKKAFDALRQLRSALGCAVIVPHHLNKSGNYSGSRAIASNGDLLFEGSDGDDSVYRCKGRSVRHSDVIASPFSIGMTHEQDEDDTRAATRLAFVPSETPEPKPTTLRDKIVACLEKHPNGVAVNYLTQATGRSAKDVKAVLEADADPTFESCSVTRNGRTFGGWRLAAGAPDEAPDSPPPDEAPDEHPTNSERS